MNFDITIFEVDTTKNMVNLTKIANAFGKRLDVWMKAKTTKDFIDALDELTPNGGSSNLTTQNGNGTWGTRDVALELAQWISPKFKVFCIKKLDELFQTGKTELVKPIPQNDMDLMIVGLQAAQRVIAQKDIQIEAQTVKIAELKPKAEYTDAVLDSASTWTTTLIANELGMSAQKLHRELCVLKFIYEHERTYVLYAKYKGEGYDATRTHITHGGTHTNIYLVWTEKGRNYIHSIVPNRKKAAANNQTEMPLRMAQ